MSVYTDPNRQLQDGYRQRLEREVLVIQTSAKKVVGLIEEFACSQIVLNDGDIEVTIKSTDDMSDNDE